MTQTLCRIADAIVLFSQVTARFECVLVPGYDAKQSTDVSLRDVDITNRPSIAPDEGVTPLSHFAFSRQHEEMCECLFDDEQHPIDTRPATWKYDFLFFILQVTCKKKAVGRQQSVVLTDHQPAEPYKGTQLLFRPRLVFLLILSSLQTHTHTHTLMAYFQSKMCEGAKWSWMTRASISIVAEAECENSMYTFDGRKRIVDFVQLSQAGRYVEEMPKYN